MGFGCSFSLETVESIDFIETQRWKRLLRTIIGFGFYLSSYKLLDKLVSVPMTKIIIKYTIVPYLIYGPFLILCQYLYLVDKEDDTSEEENNDTLQTEITSTEQINTDITDKDKSE